MADYATAAPAAPALPRVSAATLRGWAARAPLAVILIAQAFLTARLIHTSSASGDEGRYIYAGHQLIHELWHGGGSPYYETYFSGAPVIYPVLAALADHAGGLVAVRLMSTSFMLTATGLLYGSARRLFGYWAGVAAAGLFAGLGLTQDLGALGTHDALALMLTATAAWCAVRTGPGERRASRFLVLVPVMLLAANATKYATLIFDPVVIGLTALQAPPGQAWRRAGAVALTTVTALGVAAFLAGRAYVNGILFSTLDRKAGTSAIFAATKVPLRTIVTDSWDWVGLVVVLGALGLAAALAVRGERRTAGPLLALLIAAGVLVTVESLRLHTIESMKKHDDIGIWFTCIAAGYLLGRLSVLARGQAARAALAAIVPAAILASGLHYSERARSLYEAATSAQRLAAFAAIRPYLELPAGRFLIGGLDDEQMVYTDGLAIPWSRLDDDVYLKYPVPGRGGDARGLVQGRVCAARAPGCVYLEGAAGYQEAIAAHYFAVISMLGSHHTRLDAQIIAAVTAPRSGYVRLTSAGGARTWIYPPDYRNARLPGRAG